MSFFDRINDLCDRYDRSTNREMEYCLSTFADLQNKTTEFINGSRDRVKTNAMMQEITDRCMEKVCDPLNAYGGEKILDEVIRDLSIKTMYSFAELKKEYLDWRERQ